MKSWTPVFLNTAMRTLQCKCRLWVTAPTYPLCGDCSCPRYWSVFTVQVVSLGTSHTRTLPFRKCWQLRFTEPPANQVCHVNYVIPLFVPDDLISLCSLRLMVCMHVCVYTYSFLSQFLFTMQWKASTGHKLQWLLSKPIACWLKCVAARQCLLYLCIYIEMLAVYLFFF